MTKEICRLCLQTITKIYQIEESTLKIFKLNPRISREPVICTKCASYLDMFSNFKPACVYMGNSTLGLTGLRNEDPADETTSNLKSLEETGVKCSFCAKVNGKASFITSLIDSEIVESLVNLLKQHIPEMNLKNTGELFTCENCHDSLRDLCNFILKCLEVEEKINKYTEIKGTNHEGQVELKDIQQFIFDPTVKLKIDLYGVNELGEKCDQIQKETAEAEIKYENDVNNPETIIKQEHVDIKLETIIKTEDVDVESEDVDIKLETIIKAEGIDIKSENSESEKFLSTVVSSQPISTTILRKRIRVKSKGKTSNEHKLTCDEVSKATMFQCDVCSYQAKHKNRLKQHMISHKSSSEVKMHRCDSCDFSTKYKQSLRQHLLGHIDGPVDFKDVRLYWCDSCGYATNVIANLNNHKLMHKDPLEVTMYQCTSCSFQTKYKNALQRHIDKHTPKSAMYQCYSCDFSTKQKRCLREHMLIHKDGFKKKHSETKMYQCHSCGYNTKYKQTLRNHISTHNKDPFKIPKYQCDSCNYRTNHMCILNNHKLKHKDPSEVTMYQCDSCSFQTKYKLGMEKHKADVHLLKEKRHQCGECDFKTKYKHSLAKHIFFIHKDPSEINFYYCDSCDYKTKYKDSLRGHVVKHKLPSETIMYHCDSCSFVTKNKSYFNKHKKWLCTIAAEKK